MAVAALVVYVAWLGLAVGVRTAIALRRTGDSGWRGVSGRPFSAEWSAGALLVVAIAIGVAAPVAALLGLDPLVDSSALSWVGVATAAAGVLLTLAAQMSMGESWRIGVDASEQTTLVTGGAFTVVRNPIFSAMIVTAVGLTLMVPNVLAIIALAALVTAIELQVRRVEEPYLLSVHGSDYADYSTRVGRFVPGVGRIPSRQL